MVENRFQYYLYEVLLGCTKVSIQQEMHSGVQFPIPSTKNAVTGAKSATSADWGRHPSSDRRNEPLTSWQHISDDINYPSDRIKQLAVILERDTHPTATSSLIDAANLEIIPALTYVSRPIWIRIFHWNKPSL